MSRYRLRFLLQEIDLPQGETLIGRSASCHVTIEDPLVSRQHARINIEGSRVTAEDLGSRNGLVVNGRAVKGTLELTDGDRLRIGTQELVFCAVRAPAGKSNAGTRPTGFMCHCAACGLPYPAEAVQCPSCGSRERMDEDTVSGVVAEPSDRNWTLQLLVDVLYHAASLQRWDDVDRMLRRSQANIAERVASGAVVEREHLDRLAEAASRLAEARKNAEWGSWLLEVYATLGMVPHPSITDRLSTLPPAERASLAPAAHRVVESVNARGGPSEEDLPGFTRVESLTAPGTSD